MSQIFKSSSSSNIVAVTNPSSYPYQVKATDAFIVVNSSAPITINLMNPAIVGFRIIIKDGSGQANANAISIEGNGITIDGSPDYVIADTYGSVVLIFNGVEWNIIN